MTRNNMLTEETMAAARTIIGSLTCRLLRENGETTMGQIIDRLGVPWCVQAVPIVLEGMHNEGQIKLGDHQPNRLTFATLVFAI